MIDLDAVSTAGGSEELDDLDLEEEAMKVLMELAPEYGLENDKELIRDIYRAAVAQHAESDQSSISRATGEGWYETITASLSGQGDTSS